MVVPASGVIVLEQLGAFPCVQQEIHLVLLPPGERLAQELPGLVEVEISGPQEPQHMLILWDLRNNKAESDLQRSEYNI